MKVEVNLDLVFHLAQRKMTDTTESSWAIGQVITELYPEFQYANQQLIDLFSTRYSQPLGDTSCSE